MPIPPPPLDNPPKQQEPTQELAPSPRQEVNLWSRERLDLIKRTLVPPDITDTEFALFVEVCKRRGLDPFLRHIYAVKRGGKLTIQTSIDGYRLIAERTGKYLGQTAPEWCGDDGVWKDVWTGKGNPFACRIGVFKANQQLPTVAIGYWSTYATVGPFWQKSGPSQLAKCLPGKALVCTDKGTFPISEVVNQKMAVKVRSINWETGKEEWAPITNWYRNGASRTWVLLTVPSGLRGHRPIRLSMDHPVKTDRGWVPAGDLDDGDQVGVVSQTLSFEQTQLIRGSLLGDAHLAGHQNSRSLPYFAVSHSTKQKDYLDWKARSLRNFTVSVQVGSQSDGAGGLHPTARLRTNTSPALLPYRNMPAAKLLEGLDRLGLAVWIMDDGNITKTGSWVGIRIYCCGFGVEFANQAIAWFKARLGVAGRVHRPKKNPYISFGVKSSKAILDWIKDFLVVRDSRGGKRWVSYEIPVGLARGLSYVPISSKVEVTRKKSEGRYDIEVRGNHNFVVNGLVVSNCTESLALRKAFPEELSGIYTNEEMQQSDDEFTAYASGVRMANENAPIEVEPHQPVMIFPKEVLTRNQSGALVKDTNGVEWIVPQQFDAELKEKLASSGFMLIFYVVDTGRRVITGLGSV